MRRFMGKTKKMRYVGLHSKWTHSWKSPKYNIEGTANGKFLCDFLMLVP